MSGEPTPPADEGWRYSIVPLCPLRRPRHCFPQSSRGLSHSRFSEHSSLQLLSLLLHSTPAVSSSIFLCFFFFSSSVGVRPLSSCLVLSGAERSACACALRPCPCRAAAEPSALAPALRDRSVAALRVRGRTALAHALCPAPPLRKTRARLLGRSRRPTAVEAEACGGGGVQGEQAREAEVAAAASAGL